MSKPALYLSLPSYGRMRDSRRKNGRKLVKRTTPLKLSSKPIRRRSKAMAKRMAVYRQEVREWLRDKWCAVDGMAGHSSHPATECHHRNGRNGSLLTDKRFWVPVCDLHHRWIHDHPEQARREGLLCAKGDWNKQL